MKKIVSFLLIFSIIFCLCSCGKDNETTLIIPIKSDPLCLDPQVAETDSSKIIINNCFEGLVRLDKNGKIIPGVAQSWDISNDKLQYTFHLRDNSNWQLLNSYEDFLPQNYKETFDTTVKAQDFVFAFKRAVSPATKSNDVQKLFCIKNAKAIFNGAADIGVLGIKASDDKTLVINLERANDDFLRILTLPVCMPCNEEFFNVTGSKYGLEVKYTFCNGPFYLSKWTDDNFLSIIRNECYSGNSKVSPASVYFYINNDDESIVTKLKQQTYDCAVLNDNTNKELESNNKIKRIENQNKTVGMMFNCSDDVLKNENMRKALSMLIKQDKLKLSDKSLAKGIIPECVRFGEYSYREFVGDVSIPKYNEQAALKLWKKGLEEQKFDNAKITIICNEEYSPEMQSIIQDWQRVLGTTITAKVEILSDEDVKKKIKNDSYQITVEKITSESATISENLMFFTTGSSYNSPNFYDSTYDTLVNNIISVYSGDEIINKCKEAEQMLISKAVFLPFYSESEYVAISSKFDGIYFTPAVESACFINGVES